MKLNAYDILVFEDETGSIYQDCVCSIEQNIISGNQVKLMLDNCQNIDHICIGAHTYKFKEVWSRADSHTYKKVYESVDGELVKISYYNGQPVYHRMQNVTYEQIKNFTVKEK